MLALCDEWRKVVAPLVVDVTTELHNYRKNGDNIMFEGAQGSLLDVDHGTYPYVTSSNTTAGGVSSGSGLGPLHLDYVLGITKAYTTRVGAGPFPTELVYDAANDTVMRLVNTSVRLVMNLVPLLAVNVVVAGSMLKFYAVQLT